MRAWLLTLVWFVVALIATLGAAPFAYLAWTLPAWLLFRRTARRWAGESDAARPNWFPRAGAVLALAVLLLTAWASAVPPEASATLYDVVFAAVYGLCLLYPPAFVVWVLVRSKRIAATEATRPR
jgi:hypothetical protein